MFVRVFFLKKIKLALKPDNVLCYDCCRCSDLAGLFVLNRSVHYTALNHHTVALKENNNFRLENLSEAPSVVQSIRVPIPLDLKILSIFRWC